MRDGKIFWEYAQKMGGGCLALVQQRPEQTTVAVAATSAHTCFACCADDGALVSLPPTPDFHVIIAPLWS